MAAVGGSIESVSISGRLFSVAGDSDFQFNLGGYSNEIQMNGDKTGRIIKTSIPFNIDSITLSVDLPLGDFDFLNDVKNGNDYVPISITLASGAIYQGLAIITGDMVLSSQNTSVTLALSGPGDLTLQ